MRAVLHRVALSALLAVAAPASGQPLIEHVPDNAVVYVGWAGTGADSPGYADSKTRQVIETAELAETTKALFESLRQLAEAEGAAEGVGTIEALARTFAASWRRATAAYVLPPVGPDAPPRLTVLWRSGEEDERLIADLEAMLADAVPSTAQAGMTPDGAFVVLTLGHDAGHVVPGAGRSLADNERFVETRAHGADRPALSAYIDVERIVARLDELGEQETNRQAFETWRRVSRALGLRSLRRVMLSGAFVETEWQVDLFVDAPRPREGLITVFEGPPLDEEELAMAPASSMWLHAVRLDPAKVLDGIRRVIDAAGPEERGEFDAALQRGGEAVGLDLERQIIDALGDRWVAFGDPGATGGGGLGGCLINPLRDAEAMHAALTRLESLVNERPADPNAPFQLRFEVVERGGVEIHTLTIPFLSPSWAIADDRLYASLLPQAIMSAHDFAGSDRPSILTNEALRQVQEKLGGQAPVSFTFVDLRRTAPMMYQQLLGAAQMISAITASQGAPVTIVLPPFSAVAEHLAPAGQVVWVDEAGFHARTRSPFIGAGLLGPQTMTAGGAPAMVSVPMAVGILLPALGAARRTARQMQSSTQLRGIHQASLTWAQPNQGRLTDDLGTLVVENYFTVEYALSPMSGKRPPPDFERWPDDRKRQWVRQNASYVLLPGLVDDVDSERVAGFGIPEDHDGGENGIPVVYNDNHVEWTPDLDKVRRLIAEQNDGLTMEQVIDRFRRGGEEAGEDRRVRPPPAP